jgi:hypothetical protein
LDEIRQYIINNTEDIRKYIVQLMSDEPVYMQLFGYETEEPDLITLNTIFSLMVISGLLCYHDKTLFIPNKEVMLKFGNLLSVPQTGNLSKVLEDSSKLLQATINQDEETVARLIERAHSINADYFTYNRENTLSCIVSIAYFAAKDKYNIKKEDTSGKGRADFAFLPLNPSDTAFILELKVSKSVDKALEQIKSRDYAASLAPYTGKKLAVAICYDDDDENKKHFVKIEELQ